MIIRDPQEHLAQCLKLYLESQLLLFAEAGIRSDKYIRFAIADYIIADQDLKRCQLMNQVPDLKLDELCVRMKRQFIRRRATLDLLDVDVVIPAVGDSYAPHLFEVQTDIPTVDATADQCVADVLQPAFTWTLQQELCFEPGRLNIFTCSTSSLPDWQEVTA